MGNAFLIVMMFNNLKSTHNLNSLSFFLTNSTGAAYGVFDFCINPCCSNSSIRFFNSSVSNCEIRYGGLAVGFVPGILWILWITFLNSGIIFGLVFVTTSLNSNLINPGVSLPFSIVSSVVKNNPISDSVGLTSLKKKVRIHIFYLLFHFHNFLCQILSL